MSSQNSPNLNPKDNKDNIFSTTPGADVASELGGVDIQQELNRLEEMVLSSPHIPLTRRTIVDEELLLEQLDLIRLHLPPVLQTAQAIVEQKQAILFQASQQAEEIVHLAQDRAAQMLSETAIVQQAELEATQILQQVQQHCITLHEETMVEIDLMRQQAQQETNQMRQNAIAQSQEIQTGADEYADSVLNDLEQQLKDILRIIYNGRQQLKTNVPHPGNSSSGSVK